MVKSWTSVSLSTLLAVTVLASVLPVEAESAFQTISQQGDESGNAIDSTTSSQDEMFSPMAKKAPRGFVGMRGKKVSSGVDGLHRRLEDDAYDYNTALDQNEDDLVQAMELLKRTPMGFIGMRGKKAPSGFVGMRGKKAPRGFVGMRGKKAAPRWFLGMRGKRTSPEGYREGTLYRDYPIYDELESLSEVHQSEEKRAPRGFLGMRGKKAAEELDSNLEVGLYDDVISDTLTKRRPMGFIGMRG